MKRTTLLPALFCFLVAGCSIEENQPSISEEVQEITIRATIGEDEPLTRSIRLENGSIWWTPGDQISVFYGSGTDGGSRFTSQATENSRVTNFTGTIGVITGGGEVSMDQTYFWGIYPYNETAECDGSTVVTDVPANQVAMEGTFAPGTYNWIGRSQGLMMSFYGLCGGIKFKVNKEGVRKATLKTLDGSAIAGRVRIAVDANGTPSVAEVIDGKDEVVLEASAGEYFVPGKYYFFVTLPHNFSESYFTVKFETFTEEGTYERKRELEIKRADFISFTSALDGSVTYEKKTGNIPVEDAAFKNYLTQNFDTNGDGEISYEEAEAVNIISMNPSNQYNLTSLQGIEYMPNLEEIQCWGDWDDNAKKNGGDLTALFGHYYVGPYAGNWSECYGPVGTLKFIDVTNNPKLRLLDLHNNSALGVELGTIDLTHNPELVNLFLGCTWLYYPDISNNIQLRDIDFSHDRNTDIPDLSSLVKVVSINMGFPQRDSGDNISGGDIDLDVSHMPNLERLALECRVRSLSDLSANPKLKELNLNYCWSFGSIDVSTNYELERLDCSNTNASKLDVSNNPKLQHLDCSCNNLASIDLSNNSLLVDLDCAITNLTSLDVTNNSKLVRLAFNDNNIPTIDLSRNPLLEEIACWNCGLTSLDLTNNPALTWIRCWGNKIATLNVSKNLQLGSRSTVQGETGIVCPWMNDENGNNLLETIFIAEGQVIPFVTENRSNDAIPAGTKISIAPEAGGGEGSTETPETP